MEGFLKFLGTGGARFVASSQKRATGGLWLRHRDTNLYIDPGVGAMVRLSTDKGMLDPSTLDGIILTHKHLDHANDVNVLIEAMTGGGRQKRGTLFCPEDAVTQDPVVLKYLHNFVERIEFLKEGGVYTIKDVTFSTPVRHSHPVETYGLILHLPTNIGIIADTRFFEKLPDYYRTADCLIVHVLRTTPIESHDTIEHLSFHDFRRIVEQLRPRMAVMTHFGTKIIDEGPDLLAAQLSRETGLNIVAAQDGMVLEF